MLSWYCEIVGRKSRELVKFKVTHLNRATFWAFRFHDNDIAVNLACFAIHSRVPLIPKYLSPETKRTAS